MWEVDPGACPTWQNHVVPVDNMKSDGNSCVKNEWAAGFQSYSAIQQVLLREYTGTLNDSTEVKCLGLSTSQSETKNEKA